MTRALVLAALVSTAAPVSAQESVSIALPSTVTFTVADIQEQRTADFDPVSVQFSTAILIPGRVLRISVLADAPTLSGPGGSTIPVSALSWTVLSAVGGTGVGGTLSSSAYRQVFQGSPLTLSGSFDLSAMLMPAAARYAGNHSVALRWKIEAVWP